MPRGLVAFDLDGTLLRGPTVCEVIAAPLGRAEEMRRFERLSSEPEIAAARVTMAAWYREHEVGQLQQSLHCASWAPGAREAVALLQAADLEVAIASITWKFAVGWFAERLSARHFLGTQLKANGAVEHVWGRDKARWVAQLVQRLGIPPDRVAAVGDSANDGPLLQTASLAFYVGAVPLSGVPGLVHLPAADLREVAAMVLQAWAA